MIRFLVLEEDMQVLKTTVSAARSKVLYQSSHGEYGHGRFTEAVRRFIDDPEATRLAFAGRTRDGLGGVVLIREQGALVKITGHKLEGVSDDLEIEYTWFAESDLNRALEAFLAGYAVRITARNSNGAVELRWNPFAPEVYGAGEYSALTEQSD